MSSLAAVALLAFCTMSNACSSFEGQKRSVPASSWLWFPAPSPSRAVDVHVSSDDGSKISVQTADTQHDDKYYVDGSQFDITCFDTGGSIQIFQRPISFGVKITCRNWIYSCPIHYEIRFSKCFGVLCDVQDGIADGSPDGSGEGVGVIAGYLVFGVGIIVILICVVLCCWKFCSCGKPAPSVRSPSVVTPPVPRVVTRPAPGIVTLRVVQKKPHAGAVAQSDQRIIIDIDDHITDDGPPQKAQPTGLVAGMKTEIGQAVADEMGKAAADVVVGGFADAMAEMFSSDHEQ